MSEQSGGGPITREQVERLLADTLAGGNAFSSFYRSPQRELAPAYVLGAWEEDGGLRDVMEPALTRWRDELAAAEPVRRVARWDAAKQPPETLAYRLKPPHDLGEGRERYWATREEAIAWGYTIEDGPEPIDDTAPERLRERRRGVGWTLGDAARASGLAVSDVSALESGHAGNPYLPRYAAALSAEESARAADRQEAEAHRVARQTPDPERPAPRFKVGDWVRVVTGPNSAGRTTPILVTCITSAGYIQADGATWASEHLEPASPPTPVVDVPQPIVKRCACPDVHDDVEAEWRPGEPYLTVTHTTVPLALLRAMLEAIDAQQQPDPQPDLAEGWRVVTGDTAFAMPFGTIRECSGCGCLVSGGPTACRRCADAQQGGAS